MQILSTEFRLQFTLLGSAPGNFGRNVSFQELTPSFQTAFRFDKLTQLTWSDCQKVGRKIAALRIKGRKASSRMCTS